jgi:SAM-dependent methyltransferase
MNNSNVNEQFFSEMWGGERVFHYLENSAGTKWFSALLGDLIKNINPNEVQTIADLGCGIGIKAAHMAKKFSKADVFGYDFAEPAIQAANKYWNYKNLSFSTNDITNDNNKKYDIVCMFDVLEHLEDWKKMIDKIIIIANKYIILSFPTGRMRPYEKHIGHYRNFVRGEVEAYISGKGNFYLMSRYNAGFPFFSPILRDLTNIFFKEYAEITHHKMSIISYIGHNLYYFLLRYLSFRNIGDNCMLLFKKKYKRNHEKTIKSNDCNRDTV